MLVGRLLAFLALGRLVDSREAVLLTLLLHRGKELVVLEAVALEHLPVERSADAFGTEAPLAKVTAHCEVCNGLLVVVAAPLRAGQLGVEG